jgi:tRNA1(Val) A37 N6-methylase TrmN6
VSWLDAVARWDLGDETEDVLFQAMAAARGVDVGARRGGRAIARQADALVADLPAEALASWHEGRLSRTHRRRHGVYYTPPALAAGLVAATVRPTDRALVDPACGGGAFLIAAFRHLVAAGVRDPLARLHGVDLDPDAVRVTQRTLALAKLERPGPRRLSLSPRILVGDGLTIPARRFASVIGNPPWGQKGIAVDEATRQAIQTRFPSTKGIFDWFRPFVARAIELLTPGGRLGLVLPDILLLKDYEPTRALLLEETTLLAIERHGMAFPGAVIDAITLVAERAPAPPRHRVRLDGGRTLPQRDFAANPRRTFNLELTPARRTVLTRLAAYSRVGDWYEIHEGVHSGNLREALFVPRRVDDTCRQLYFGRGELADGALTWGGQWVRLGAVPPRRSREAYANLGQPAWHERRKILVRRTGDRVSAAVDERGYYASNNFFVVFPRDGAPLSLDVLCRYLNSDLATWYFRAVSPRTGRAFAELKIRHLADFPLPPDPSQPWFGLRALPP